MLASLALGIGLLAGSFAWLGYTLERTVGDPDRADAVVDVRLDDAGVQEGIAAAAVPALRRSLPAEVTVAVPADQLAAATCTAMATPPVQETVRAALLGVHGYV